MEAPMSMQANCVSVSAERQSPRWLQGTVEVDGARVHYVEAGQGEVVLLLHGYPQDHRAWRHQIGALSARYRVIAPDWLGFGRSERRLDVAPDYEAESERIGRFADQLGLSRFNLICHDYGGYIGLGYVIRHADRVLRFALLNSRAHGTFRPWFYRFSLVQGWVARHALMRRLAALLPLAALHRRGLRRYVALGCFSEELGQAYVSWMDPPAGRRWFYHFFAHYHLPVRPELGMGLANISCPVAIIWGDRDPYIPFSTAQELSARIARATLTQLPGADHFVMEERPDEVNQALEQLLATPLA
jgi:pimeloyl-ACP methyl ester carboxylesterase